MRRVLRVALVVTVALAALGCSDSEEQSTGRFTATVREVGGPAPGLNRLVAGKVALTDASGHVHRAGSQSGRISVDLAVGRYRAEVTSPLINSGESRCNGPASVTVKRGETTHAAFVCDIF